VWAGVEGAVGEVYGLGVKCPGRVVLGAFEYMIYK
jgi:hypothetical protein